MPSFLRKKWFWVSVILLFIFSIIFDLAVATGVLVTSLGSGRWSNELLGLGFLYAIAVTYQPYLENPERGQVKLLGRIVLLLVAYFAFSGYGFWQGFYFLATVFIFARFVRWLSRIFLKKRSIASL